MPDLFFFYSDIKDYLELNIKFTRKIFKTFLNKIWSYLGIGVNENTCYGCFSHNDFYKLISSYKLNKTDKQNQIPNIEDIIFIEKKRLYPLKKIKNKQEVEYFIRILSYLEVIS